MNNFRFGSGLTLRLTIPASSPSSASLLSFLRTRFSRIEGLKRHGNTVGCRVTGGEAISTVYGLLMEEKAMGRLADFVVAPTSLDEVRIYYCLQYTYSVKEIMFFSSGLYQFLREREG